MYQNEKLAIAISIITLVTFFTRVFPFIAFGSKDKKPNDMVVYVGKYLPPAIICCILVYCFKDVVLLQSPFGIPEMVSAMVVILLHLYKGNALLSILSGTLIYMFFTQVVYLNF